MAGLSKASLWRSERSSCARHGLSRSSRITNGKPHASFSRRDRIGGSKHRVVARPVFKTQTPHDVLREFVADHGMKNRELGALLGVSPSAASMILKGDRALTLHHVRKLAERFKVSTALFVGGIASIGASPHEYPALMCDALWHGLGGTVSPPRPCRVVSQRRPATFDG